MYCVPEAPTKLSPALAIGEKLRDFPTELCVLAENCKIDSFNLAASLWYGLRVGEGKSERKSIWIGIIWIPIVCMEDLLIEERSGEWCPSGCCELSAASFIRNCKFLYGQHDLIL